MKIIAELCQNHSGSLDVLLSMADVAAECGATHIKMQHISPNSLAYRPEFEYLVPANSKDKFHKYRPYQDEFNRLQNLELSSRDCIRFVEHVKALGLVPLTTCFTYGDLDLIADQGFDEIKLASYDCASYPLVRSATTFFNHIYVSTGATYFDEISKTASILQESGKNFSLLHCTTIYPTPFSSINLAKMQILKTLAPNTGFSDHTLSSDQHCLATKAAIVLGANVIERHFTIFKSDQTKDGPVSITANQLKDITMFAGSPRPVQLDMLDSLFPEWRSVLVGSEDALLTHEEIINRSYYRGRFATPRFKGAYHYLDMIPNWDEALQ